MKIALVRPNYKSHLITPPLGLGYISSYLKSKEKEVKIIDGLNLNLSNEEIVDLCKNFDLIGINVLSFYYLKVKDLCEKLKKAGKIVVLGGPHAMIFPDKIMEETGADYINIGEGEEAINELVDVLEKNNNDRHIPGIFKKGEKNFIKRPFIEPLDKLPFPDWEQIDPRKYKKAPHGGLIKNFPVAPIISSRGCPYECTFCASPKIWDRKIRFRLPENVVKEIEYLVKNFGVKEIHFEDDNLTLSKDHVTKICNLILEKGIKISWATPNGIRADMVDFELLKLMKKAGCYYIVFGIESGNQEILDKIKKRETLEDINRAVGYAKKLKIMTQGFFILGLPGETERTINNSIKFAKKIGLDRAQFLLLDLLPGSQLWEEHKNEIEGDYYSLDSFQQVSWVPSTISKAVLEKAQSKAFKEFFFRPGPIFSLIKFFRFSQLKFIWQRIKDFHIVKK